MCWLLGVPEALLEHHMASCEFVMDGAQRRCVGVVPSQHGKKGVEIENRRIGTRIVASEAELGDW